MIQEHFMTQKENFEPTEAELMCKKTCKKMTNKVFLRAEDLLRESNEVTRLILKFEKTFRVEKKIAVYSWFNFVIDIGSSLGLWLGLSALGITDLAIKAVTVATKWMKIK